MKAAKPAGRQQKILLVILLVALFVGLSFFVEFEKIVTNKGFAKEAQKNPYLAAEMFLEKHGVETERSIQFSKLNNLYADSSQFLYEPENNIEPYDTLMLIHARGLISGQRYDQIWQWVNDGGTLVMTSTNPFLGSAKSEDELFQKLGVRVRSFKPGYSSKKSKFGFFSDDEQSDEDNKESSSAGSKEESNDIDESSSGVSGGGVSSGDDKANLFEPNDSLLVEGDSQDQENDSQEWKPDAGDCPEKANYTLTLPGRESPLQIDVWSNQAFVVDNGFPEAWSLLVDDKKRLEPRPGEDEAALLERDKYEAAEFNVGAGAVVILPSVRLFENRNIQCFDHAYLLWSLVSKEGKLWIFENRDAPSLLALSWTYLPAAMVTLIMLFVFLVWSALIRFGPVFYQKETGRRSFSEHIFASANFMWKQSEYIKLIVTLRQSIDGQMQRRVFSFDKLSQEEKLEHIARVSRVDKNVINEALFKPGIDSLNEFVGFVRILKLIKEKL